MQQDTQRFLKAIQDGKFKKVFDFLQAGIDVNTTDEYGTAALFYALEYERENVAKLLILHGADVNAVNAIDDTPLLLATDMSDVVELLLDKNARVNAANYDGQTPLMAAVKNNNVDSVRLLLNAKADVNITDKDGKTPLMLAVGNDDFYALSQTLTVIDMLLEAGADINAANNADQTAFSLALENRNMPEITTHLLSKGALPHGHKITEQKTPHPPQSGLRERTV